MKRAASELTLSTTEARGYLQEFWAQAPSGWLPSQWPYLSYVYDHYRCSRLQFKPVGASRFRKILEEQSFEVVKRGQWRVDAQRA